MQNVLLAEIDRGYSWNHLTTGMWVNRMGGIFYTIFNGSYPLIDDDLEEGAPTLEVKKIGTVFADTVRLVQVDSLLALLPEPSFYWVSEDNALYIRLPDFDHPRHYSMCPGITMCIRHGGQKSVYTGLIYEDRIVSLPRIGRERDRLFFGRLSFDNARIGIANADGAYDDLRDYDLFNQGTRFYLGDDSKSLLSKFTKKGDFRVDAVTVGQRRVTIEASDPRKALSIPLPPLVFSSADYPDIHERDENRPIPLGYGRVREAPVICTNRSIYDKSAAQMLVFKICDTTHHAIKEITAVYHGDTELSVLKSLETASFTYSKSAGEEIDFSRVLVTYQGYVDDGDNLIENPVEIIADLLELYGNWSYSSDHYDTAEIAIEKAKMWDCAVHAEKLTTISQIVEKLMASTLAQFIILDDGRYTFRKRDTTKAIAAIVEGWEILNLRDIELTFDTDELLSSCVVVYDRGRRLPIDTYEAEVAKRFRKLQEKEFETLLVAEADAAAHGDERMLMSKELLPPIDLRLPWWDEFTSLQIGDLIGVYLPRLKAEWQGHIKCEIEGAFIDPMAFQVEARARVLEFGDAFDIVLDGGEAGDGLTDSIDGGSAGDDTIVGIVTGGAAA